jgi:hypothetical protein
VNRSGYRFPIGGQEISATSPLTLGFRRMSPFHPTRPFAGAARGRRKPKAKQTEEVGKATTAAITDGAFLVFATAPRTPEREALCAIIALVRSIVTRSEAQSVGLPELCRCLTYPKPRKMREVLLANALTPLLGLTLAEWAILVEKALIFRVLEAEFESSSQ